MRASNSGTMEVTGTDAYGVYALNRGNITTNQGVMVATGVIFTTDIHGVWAENTNADSDTSVRAENKDSGASITTTGVMMHMDYMRALLVQDE